MLTVSEVTKSYGGKVLFDDVTTTFDPGNRYGLTGANGAGKSTFMKILAGELEPDLGEVTRPAQSRLSMLHQDHYRYEHDRIRDVVLAFGGKVVMTSPDHPTGTDRLAEAVKAVPAATHVINIQGDEPLIDPGLIDELAAAAGTPGTFEGALATVENAIAQWRLIGEAQHAHNTAPGPDRITRQIAPVQALREDDEGLSGPCDCGEGAIHYTTAGCPAEQRQQTEETR